MIRLKRGIAALLSTLLLLAVPARAAELAYNSSRSFSAMLRQSGVGYTAEGVDEYGDDAIAIPCEGNTILCFFGEDEQSVCIIVWYVIEYDPADELEVMRVCSALNQASDGPCFYADVSDYTVTASMDMTFSWDGAGPVSYRGYRSMVQMLSQAKELLKPYDVTPQPTPAPSVPSQSTATPAPTATAAPAVTPRPAATPSPTPCPSATPTPAPAVTRIIITAASARIRTGPGVNSPYLCTVRQGESFPVLGVMGDWYIVDCDGRTGFVSMSVASPQ